MAESVDRVLTALQERGTPAKQHADYWLAKCPAHDDKNPSLSISAGTDGRTLVKCHAGCEPLQITAALGLTVEDLFAPRQSDDVVARYVYTDEAGSPLFRVSRTEQKRFFQERWTGTSYVSGLSDTRRVLYHLPAVMDAVVRGDLVYVAEGEKDADALTKAGVTATTAPMGAGKWRDEYRWALASGHVVIVADKDAPGYAHAEKVAESLEGTAASVRVTQAATGKDASDHLAAGHAPEDFVDVDASSLEEAPVDDDDQGGTDRLGEPVWFCDAVREGLPVLAPPLIEGVLRQGHKMTLAGGSKASKSFALISLAVAIAEGREWIGWPCSQGRVLYLNFEIDGPSCLDRFATVYKALGLTPATEDLAIWNLRGRAMAIGELVPRLIQRARRITPVAIILDPLYKVMPGDENSARDIALFCNSLDQIANELGCAVITCHHHSKGSQGYKNSIDRASGSGVFARDPDALLDMILLEKTPELVKQQLNEAACGRMATFLDTHGPTGWRDDVSQDALAVEQDMRDTCVSLLGHGDTMNTLIAELAELELAVREYKALRIEGTLREFRTFRPRNIWFRHPIHQVDTEGVLKDLMSNGEKRRSAAGETSQKKLTAADYISQTMTAFEVLAVDGIATVADIAEYLSVQERRARDRIDAAGLKRDHGKVSR